MRWNSLYESPFHFPSNPKSINVAQDCTMCSCGSRILNFVPDSTFPLLSLYWKVNISPNITGINSLSFTQRELPIYADIYKNFTNKKGSRCFSLPKNICITQKYLKIKILTTVQIYQMPRNARFLFQRCWLRPRASLIYPRFRNNDGAGANLIHSGMLYHQPNLPTPLTLSSVSVMEFLCLLFLCLSFFIFICFDVNNPADPRRWPNFHP